MTPDWAGQRREYGEWMLRQLQGLGCHPRQTSCSTQYSAHCPFHDDNTPSFSLNVAEGIFYCFACKFGGTIEKFSYLLETKGYEVDRRSALNKSSRQRQRRDLRRRTEKSIMPVDLHALSACYQQVIERWHHVLLENPKYRCLVCDSFEAQFIKRIFDRRTWKLREEQYQYVSPRLTDETLQRFQVGFAPPSNATLVRELRRSFSIETIIATGLFRPHGNNATVCLLAGRVIYPYLMGGRPVYAIGRITPYTPANLAHGKYFKQKTLLRDYQLPLQNPPLFNVDVIERTPVVLITEGVTDAIAACQAATPAVSPVTTIFQKNKLDEIAGKLIRKKVIICNDSELSGTGERSAERMRIELAARGVDAQCVALPRREDQQKVDVCSFIREEGVAAFHSVIREQTGISFPDCPC